MRFEVSMLTALKEGMTVFVKETEGLRLVGGIKAHAHAQLQL
jgi:hypothetical protein